jgi:transmembrane sensor
MPEKHTGNEDFLSDEPFLDKLSLKERELKPGQLTRALNRLLAGISQLKDGHAPVIRLRHSKRWIAAASILLLVAGLYGRHWWLSRRDTWYTNYGEVRTNRMPDGTEITTNANTNLTYSRHWKDGEDREVWLSGEAYFHVSKTPGGSRFIVHTDHFDIIVTGTQFNAINRPDKASILLQEGSVTLLGADRNEIKMGPGEYVEYRDQGLHKAPAKEDSVLAWKDRKLIFDNTPLRRLVEIIKENYGITVQPADQAVGNKTISAILANDNLDVLLQALEATGDFKVIRDNQTIIIKER